MVERGSLKWEPRTLDLSFMLSDGKAAVPVRHHGAPPDLFAEGRGAVVEGAWSREGYFRADADHGQALRGVQGAARREAEARLQGAAQDAARQRTSRR